MSDSSEFDRAYAARRVKVLLEPTRRLETFGNTLVEYHLVSELPDNPGKVRVREGRLEAHPPRVVTPDFSQLTSEGFGPEAREYLDFLRANESRLKVLEYGCHLKMDKFSEQILTDSLCAVADRVCAAVREAGGGFSAVLVGEDDPWDVALVELWRREVVRSARTNIRELNEKGKLF